MKAAFKILLVVLVAVGAIAGLIFSYLELSRERALEHQRETPVVAESRVRRTARGEIALTLEEETQRRIALKVDLLAAAQLAPSVTAYGRVLDPTPLAKLVFELAAAQAALELASKEFARLKVLREQDENASERALQAAEAAARRDHARVESLRHELVLGWGQLVAEQSDLPALVNALTTRTSALVRVELPADRTLDPPPVALRLFAFGADQESLPARLLGAAPSVDARTQGQAFLALVEANAQRLAPGAALTAQLLLPGAPRNGVAMPRAAIVRLHGQAWAYVQTDEQTFIRRQVPLDQPAEGGWFIPGGFEPGERVVVGGAQVLLSEELKSQIHVGD